MGRPCVMQSKKKKKNESVLCEFQEEYEDSLQIEGYLVEDSIPIESSDAALQSTALAFGCTNKLKDTDKKTTYPVPRRDPWA